MRLPWLPSSFLHLFFPLLTFLSLRSLPSLQLLLSSAVVLHSPSLPRTLLLPRLLIPPTFWLSNLLPIFHLQFFTHIRPISTYSSQMSSENFPSLSVRPFFFDPLSSIPPFFLSSCFHKPATLCAVSVINKFFSPQMK